MECTKCGSESETLFATAPEVRLCVSCLTPESRVRTQVAAVSKPYFEALEALFVASREWRTTVPGTATDEALVSAIEAVEETV